DVEILPAANGLDAVIDVVGDLALSEEILLRAAHMRSLLWKLRHDACYWHSAVVTNVSVRQSSGLRCRPGIRTFAEQVSAESVPRLLPSLKPLLWQSLSAPSLQSGVPAVAGQAMRPLTIAPGLSRDSASPASFMVSLARALRSSIASPGVFSGGMICLNSLPISLIRPGLSCAGAGSGAGAACGGGPCSCR